MPSHGDGLRDTSHLVSNAGGSFVRPGNDGDNAVYWRPTATEENRSFLRFFQAAFLILSAGALAAAIVQ